MKLHTKPISSPGRTEKFPPPLMRFLRTSTGSRSRGRSRSSSSTMFFRKKNTVIETQEPSSPKVTCMGQVRARRSRPSSSTTAGATTSFRRRCCCYCWRFPHALFCGIFKTKPGSSSCCQCKPVQPNWRFFFCYRRRKKGEEASTKKPGLSFSDRENDESENDELDIENRVKANAFVSNSSCSSTPPRNALLLTRCRSAPYRSSSLASRFWGSPLRNEEEEEGEEETEHENRVPSETQIPSECDSVEGMNKDPKMEAKLRFFKELEDSFRERLMESEKVHELKRSNNEEEEEETEGDSARPLVLTRCKSEPARTAAQKLDPELAHSYNLTSAFRWTNVH